MKNNPNEIRIHITELIGKINLLRLLSFCSLFDVNLIRTGIRYASKEPEIRKTRITISHVHNKPANIELYPIIIIADIIRGSLVILSKNLTVTMNIVENNIKLKAIKFAIGMV